MARVIRSIGSRIARTGRWWLDCIEHWGWLGWHRDLWLRSITAERAIDAVTDELLERLKASRTVAPSTLTHVLRAERELWRLRALRSPSRRQKVASGQSATGPPFRGAGRETLSEGG